LETDSSELTNFFKLPLRIGHVIRCMRCGCKHVVILCPTEDVITHNSRTDRPEFLKLGRWIDPLTSGVWQQSSVERSVVNITRSGHVT